MPQGATKGGFGEAAPQRRTNLPRSGEGRPFSGQWQRCAVRVRSSVAQHLVVWALL
jgi:hypothetical protein